MAKVPVVRRRPAGNRAMKIEDVMTRDVSVVAPDATIQKAAQMMDELNIGAIPVCDGRKLLGMITDRDITVRATAAGASPDTRVADAMTADIRWCFAEDDVEEVIETMGDVQIRRVPVVDGNKSLVGIVSLGDLADDRISGAGRTLRRISSPAEPDR
jgi:CBS domain-containing protein